MLRKSFTITEMVVVCGIIAILAAVIVVGLSQARAKGRDARRVADLNLIAEKLSTYMYANKTYPDDNDTTDPKFDFFRNPTLLAVPGIAEIEDYLSDNAAGATYYYMCNRASDTPDCSQYILKACLEGNGQANMTNEKAFKIENSVTGAVMPQDGPVCTEVSP